MGYYYKSSSQQATNGSANTNRVLANLHSIAGLRAYIRKLVGGFYGAPAGDQIILQLIRTTTLLTPGTAQAPAPLMPDAPAASAVHTTLPTVGAFVSVFPLVQLAFNDRGNAMWAAFDDAEAIGILGATAPNGEIALQSQASAASKNVVYELTHSE